MATRLSCSQCPSGSYIRTTEGAGEFRCEHCDYRTDTSDIFPHLDEGESLTYDDDGYLAYELREHPHDYGYYEEN